MGPHSSEPVTTRTRSPASRNLHLKPRGGPRQEVAGLFPRLLPSLFPKLQGARLQRALPAVREMYERAKAPKHRARNAGRFLHLTYHTFPHTGIDARIRMSAVAVLLVCWLSFASIGLKLRCVTAAVLYSGMEWNFTLLERGGIKTHDAHPTSTAYPPHLRTPHALRPLLTPCQPPPSKCACPPLQPATLSVAQFVANILYTPVLLDLYGTLLAGNPVLYVLYCEIASNQSTSLQRLLPLHATCNHRHT